MMCETMANVPVEEKSSYVLTEDMIDAAMNEQFSYQEDLESEEETSSPEESAGVDQDSQESQEAENITTVENEALTTNPTVNVKTNINVNPKSVVDVSPSDSPTSNNNEVSVLVIETGLNKNGSSHIKSVKEQSRKETPNASFDNVTDLNNPTDGGLKKAVGNNISDSKENLTILKSILSDNKEKDGIIDLCESEADDFSEDDQNEAESIDDELRSVMETNLMAEIGISVNKKPQSESNTDSLFAEKGPDNISPRISVKNISQISTQAFNSLPQNGCATSIPQSEVTKCKANENQCTRNPSFAVRNPSYNANVPISVNNQCPSSIHINKIAIPHSSFVNSQGQKMKCVYVKSNNNLPFVINTPTQTVANNSNVGRYVLTQPMNKGANNMPAIAALKNLTKNIQPQTLLKNNNAKVLSVAQKPHKPPVLLTAPPLHHRVMKKDDRLYHALKSNIIMNNKKTYVPPDTFPEDPTYRCLDCNDKFLLKSSLSNHIERRSMIIRYWCQNCKSDLQFYNTCALSMHRRGHGNPQKKILDYSRLTISPIPKEMIEKGVVTSFFKDTEFKTNPPVKSTFISHKAIQANNSSAISTDWKAVSIGPTNLATQKLTTLVTSVAGQSKSVCYQSSSSSEVNGPITSSVTNSLSSNKVLPLPLILSKPPNQVKTTVVLNAKSSSNQVKEQTSSNTSSPKSLIVFCNKIPPSPNVQMNSVASPLPPNVVNEADPKLNSPPIEVDDNDTAMIVDDDDVSVMPNNEEEELVDVENVDGNVALTETEKSLSDKSTKNTSSSPSPTTSKRNCSECKVYCANFSKHLNGCGRPQRKDLACKICNLILPSKCALKIHHRIHMKIPPHKCPDCGKDFTSWDELHSHLKFSCGHFAKCVRFICKGCKAHFPTQNGLAHHIVKNHGKDIFKCSLCPVAFYQKVSLMKHIENDHKAEKNKSHLGLDYKQCEMCPKKLLPEESYLVHAKDHTNSMIYGYKCSMCNIVYANKMAFIIHQIKEKTKRDRDSVEKSVQNNTVRSEEPLEESLNVSDSNSDFEDEPVIIRKYPEAEDGISPEKDPLSLDDWDNTQEQKVNEKTEELCIVCKKNSVVLLPGIDLNRQSLCCKQCVKPLDGESTTEQSKGPRNNIDNLSKSKKQRQSNPRDVYRSSSTDEVKKVTKKRRSSEISHSTGSSVDNDTVDPLADSPSRKKSRKKQKGKISSKGQTHIQGQVIKSRSLDELCFKCSKCEFFAEERETFLEHITVHRTDPNTYQCLECGLCFVVLPSLERHLQMHHGITDGKSYTENYKASLPQKPAPVEEETQENQCRVCYEIFDCQSSLDKHFRIHGMAFMSRLSKSP